MREYVYGSHHSSNVGCTTSTAMESSSTSPLTTERMRERLSSPFGEASLCTRNDYPGCRDEVVLPENQVRRRITRRPQIEKGRRIGTEFIEQVG